MQHQANSRRSYGTGSIIVRGGSYFGKWRIGDRQIKRKLGPKRLPGSREGLTRKQAEAQLRRLMQEVRSAPPGERLTVSVAGARYLDHLEVVIGRRPTTIQDYRLILERQLVPFFCETGIDRIGTEDVTAFLQAQGRAGFARQTIINRCNLLHGIYGYAVKRGWATSNPVAAVDRPQGNGADPDIHFLDPAEVEALIRAVPDDLLGPTDRVLYRAAGMAGLRQGELVALTWRDIGWTAQVIRVRRSYSRGVFGAPKSRRSSRAVPMADRLARELERHFQRSRYQGDDDLVFGHPETARPYGASKMRKRFKKAVKKAKVRQVRFHDLRHSYGTAMAAAGAPLRSLMEWMGHRDLSTTLVYADYAPDQAQGAAFAERAFGAGTNPGTNLSASEDKTAQVKPLEHAK
jgi:integrase